LRPPSQPGAWPPQPGAWPQQSAWPPQPGAWPPQGGSWQHPAPFTPPGQLHPPTPPRPLLSIAGRAEPALYAIGLLVGLPFFAAFVILELGLRLGVAMPEPILPILGLVSGLSGVGLSAAAVAQARQRRVDGWQDYHGPSPLLATAAALSLLEALTVVLSTVLLNLLLAGFGASVLLLMYSFLALAVYAGLTYLLAVREGALTWPDIARPGHLAPDPSDPMPYPAPYGPAPRPSQLLADIGMALALLIPVLITTDVLIAALAIFLGLNPSDLTSPVPFRLGGNDRVLVILAVAIVIPIGEEILFRGLVANGWARSLTRNRAIAEAAILFAAVHGVDVGSVGSELFLQLVILAIAARIPIAFALTWLYLRRRSIYASIVLHGTYNGAILLISWALA
jgi:membrane protease YdiL (CAAX protease family)